MSSLLLELVCLCIISEKGCDTPSCLKEHNLPVSCQSLVMVSEYVTSNKLNNVAIRINDTNYTLQGVVRFSGVDNITVTGIDHLQAHINCNISSLKTGAGIAFHRSSNNITLTNFTISNSTVELQLLNKDITTKALPYKLFTV